MNESEELKEKLTALQNDHNRLLIMVAELQTAEQMHDNRLFATIDALVSLTQELAAKAGVSKEMFWQHYNQRVNYCLDRKMNEMEDASPRYAAASDNRDQEDFEFPDSIPPLFDEP